MMAFLGNVFWFFFALTMIVIFLCVIVVGIGVFDYALDSDIKGALVKLLGPRHPLKQLRIWILKLTKHLDTPDEKDIPVGTDGSIWKPDEDYDAEIHRLIEEIEKDNG